MSSSSNAWHVVKFERDFWSEQMSHRLLSRLGIIRNHQELKVKWSWTPARSFLEGEMENRANESVWTEFKSFSPSHLRRVQRQISAILVMANSHERDALSQTLNNVISVYESVWPEQTNPLKDLRSEYSRWRRYRRFMLQIKPDSQILKPESQCGLVQVSQRKKLCFN